MRPELNARGLRQAAWACYAGALIALLRLLTDIMDAPHLTPIYAVAGIAMVLVGFSQMRRARDIDQDARP